jgi:hypothetical protein
MHNSPVNSFQSIKSKPPSDNNKKRSKEGELGGTC